MKLNTIDKANFENGWFSFLFASNGSSELKSGFLGSSPVFRPKDPRKAPG